MFWWIATAAITVTLGSTDRRETGVYGQDLTKPAADDSIKVVYGFRGKVPGTIAWLGSNDNDTDDIKNDLMHFISVWSEGQIEGFTGTEINDFPYLNSRFNHSEGRWYYTHNFTNGMDGQFVDEQLEDAGFDTENYLYSGLAVSYERAELNAKGLFNGLPNVTKDIKGILCANFPKNSGVHTTASSVPADQLYDYLTNEIYGFGLTDEDINYSTILNGKTICNGQIFTFQDSGEYKNRFTSNLILDTSKPVIYNVKAILKTMRGGLSDVDGKLNLVLEVDHEPVDELIVGEHFFSEDLDIEFPEINSRFNRVKATFYDPSANWQKQEVVWPETNSPEDIAFQKADGGTVVNGVVTQRKEYSTTIELEGCTNYYEARTTARVLCQRSRENLTASIIGFPETLKYLPGDIVPVTDPENGFDKKLFRVDEVELLDDGDVALDLTEHQPYIYTWLDENPKPEIPDTNLIDPSNVSTPTELAVNVSANGKVQLYWNSLLPSFNYKLILDGQITQESEVSTTSLILNSLQAGEYSFELWGRNSLGYLSKQKAKLEFNVGVPAAPTIKLTSSNFSLVIEPTIASSYLNTTFNAKIHTSNEFESATDLGTGTNFTVPVEPLTEYHVWLNTINLAGVSEFSYETITTEQWSESVLASLNGQISLDNLTQNFQEIINQFDQKIANNTASNKATANALNFGLSLIDDNSQDLESVLDAVGTSIIQDLENEDKLVGFRVQLAELEDKTVLNTTNIEQSVNKIEFNAFKSSIVNLSLGDSSEAVKLALGEVEARIQSVEVYIEPDNFTTQVNQLISESDFVTNEFVTQRISALGIENLVSKYEFSQAINSIEGASEILNNDSFRRSVVSFSMAADQNESIGERQLDLQAQLILNELENSDFLGALAYSDEQIKIETDLNNSKVEETKEQIARVNEAVSLTQQRLISVVNETQITAEKTLQLEVADEKNLATAFEYTNASIGYCIDSEGNITNETDAISCVAASPTNKWQKLPLSTAIDKVSVTIKNSAGENVTLSAGSLFQVLSDTNNQLLARAFFGITGSSVQTGITVEQNSDGSVSGITAKGSSFIWLDSNGTSVMALDAETNRLLFPDGSIDAKVLTSESVDTDHIKANAITIDKIKSDITFEKDATFKGTIYASELVGDVIDADVKSFARVTINPANQTSNPVQALKFQIKGNPDFSRFLVLSALDVRHTDTVRTAHVSCEIYMSNSSTSKGTQIGSTNIFLNESESAILPNITANIAATSYNPWITVEFYRISLASNATYVGERVRSVVCQLFKKGGDFL